NLFFMHNGAISKSKEDFPQHYQIISPEIPENLDFCGEKVPLDNFYVKERVDRELIVNTYYHSATLLALKRANRWFPVIEPILKKYDIPDDFKYLSVIESNLENVISPANAVGFWQFTEAAGMKYGLEVSDDVDERYNVEMSTEAACQYLKFAYNRYKTWTLAAASYNYGIAGIDKQIERQKMRNYYNLLLGEETSRYIARIIAMKEIFKDPKKYGYFLKPADLYPAFELKDEQVNYRIDDLADFAIKKGINYKILKLFNPWLRENYLALRKGKTYDLKLPKEGTVKIISEVQ
ncbi:MAG: lytic transglycosylase domain-containing protein, partial [Bacteroidota bacterium]|nr:lytic transglycosylase domain-containing protein [Bacteroidota bacterium]